MKTTVRSLLLSILFLVVAPEKSQAEAFTLSGIEQSSVDPLLKTLAASFAFRPTEGASPLGSKWGFYIGVGGSASSTDLVSSVVSNLSTSYLPGGEAQLGIGLPMGFTVELGILPSLAFSGTTVSKTAGAVKWTLNSKFFKKIPFQFAVRALFGKSSLTYSQVDGSGTSSVTYDGTQWGSNFIVSRYLGLSMLGVEPYVGIGFLNQSSTLSAVGSANVFGGTMPVGTTSISSSGLSVWYQAGLMLKLGIFGFTAEYNNLYGISSYGGKASIRF
jgi:hypothetical protein